MAEITAALVQGPAREDRRGHDGLQAGADRDQRRHGGGGRLAAQEGSRRGREEGRPRRRRRPGRRRQRAAARRRWSRSTPRPTSSPATRRSRRSCERSPRWRSRRRRRRGAQGRAYRAPAARSADELTRPGRHIGENMTLRRAARAVGRQRRRRDLRAQRAARRVSARSACWWRSRCDGELDELEALGRQIAMHVAATKPRARHRRRRPGGARARARGLPSRRARPASRTTIIEKMVEGRHPQVLRGGRAARAGLRHRRRDRSKVVEAAKRLARRSAQPASSASPSARASRRRPTATSPPRSRPQPSIPQGHAVRSPQADAGSCSCVTAIAGPVRLPQRGTFRRMEPRPHVGRPIRASS